MENINEDQFIEAFEHIFGDFNPGKSESTNIRTSENIEVVQLEIDDFMDLIESSLQAFEKEALNIKPICITNVDTFMEEYKTTLFRTKKSMKIVKEEVKYVKYIKKGLKGYIKVFMDDFNKKQNVKNITTKKVKK